MMGFLTINWYLIKTKSNAHVTARAHLKRQGFDVFMPLISKTTKKSNKFVDTTAPLFPGYLFMGSALDPVPWKSVNGTRGVSKAVKLDGVYRPVNTNVIEGLQSRCNEDSIIQRINNIITGDRIKIEQGPFAEFICTVDQIRDEQRAWVLIDLLQQQIRAQVSLDDISKIN